MTSQSGNQIITIHILPNIPGSKGNQTMNLVREQNVTREIFFFKTHAENEVGGLVAHLILFSEQTLYGIKVVCSLVSK